MLPDAAIPDAIVPDAIVSDAIVSDATIPDPSTTVPLPKLQYSGLPAGSRIVAEPTEQGMTIKIPPASAFYALVACIFAALMLTPMTFGLVMVLRDPSHLGGRDMIVLILVALVVLAFWPAIIVTMWQTFRRRRVPTICTVCDRTLILITPDLPTLRHEFPIDAKLRIKAVSRGISPTLRAAGLLRIESSIHRLEILRGRDLREIQWIALALNGAVSAKLD